MSTTNEERGPCGVFEDYEGMSTTQSASPRPPLTASWTPDCQGKWDYDAPILSLSCRYWPRGGGFHVLSERGIEGNEARPEISPSANAAILLGDPADGPYVEIQEADFSGETETEVKAKVEAWAAEKYATVPHALDSHSDAIALARMVIEQVEAGHLDSASLELVQAARAFLAKVGA